MKIISKDIIHGQKIDKEFTCEGNDISPEFFWEGVPEETKTLALIVDDPDAPNATWVHWVVYNIPSEVKGFVKGISSKELEDKNIIQGVTDFGTQQYGGPCPPKGHGVHRYYFKLYALDTKLEIGNKATKQEVELAMEGHILDKAELISGFERK